MNAEYLDLFWRPPVIFILLKLILREKASENILYLICKNVFLDFVHQTSDFILYLVNSSDIPR
jgi:hypothetical protein